MVYCASGDAWDRAGGLGHFHHQRGAAAFQGTFSASVDEIAWVVTSYLVANGIMIPMTGWISSRFGRKRYFMTSVLAFVAASALCGAHARSNKWWYFA